MSRREYLERMVRRMEKTEQALHDSIAAKLCSEAGRILPGEVLLRDNNAVYLFPDYKS